MVAINWFKEQFIPLFVEPVNFYAVLDIPIAVFWFGPLCCSTWDAQFSFRTSSSRPQFPARINEVARS
jgi:hypothetical protein